LLFRATQILTLLTRRAIIVRAATQLTRIVYAVKSCTGIASAARLIAARCAGGSQSGLDVVQYGFRSWILTRHAKIVSIESEIRQTLASGGIGCYFGQTGQSFEKVQTQNELNLL
jgi:hypothetical protein